jgi:hypothetical protein
MKEEPTSAVPYGGTKLGGACRVDYRKKLVPALLL